MTNADQSSFLQSLAEEEDKRRQSDEARAEAKKEGERRASAAMEFCERLVTLLKELRAKGAPTGPTEVELRSAISRAYNEPISNAQSLRLTTIATVYLS